MSDNKYDGFNKKKSEEERVSEELVGIPIIASNSEDAFLKTMMFIAKELYRNKRTQVVAVIVDSPGEGDDDSLGMAIPARKVDHRTIAALIQAISILAKKDNTLHDGIGILLEAMVMGDMSKTKSTSASKMSVAKLLKQVSVNGSALLQRCHPTAGLNLVKDGDSFSCRCTVCDDEILRLTE